MNEMNDPPAECDPVRGVEEESKESDGKYAHGSLVEVSKRFDGL